MKTLIVYGTKYGTAEKCAQELSKELSGTIEICNIKESRIENLSEYDTVIVGGSIYMGMIQKEIKAFCSKNIEALKNKRLGFFICCMRQENEKVQLESAFPKELLDRAIISKSLGGTFVFDKMKFFDRFIVKMVSKADKNSEPIDMKKNTSTLSSETIQHFALAINTA